MTSRLIRRAAVTIVAAAGIIGSTVGSAHAQSDTVKDNASDVLSFADQTIDRRGTQLGYSESVASGVDVRSLRVSHTKKSVKVTAKFSNLDDATTVYVALRINGRSTPTRLLVNTYDDRGTVVTNGGRKRCSVPLTTRVGSNGLVRATIKRSCLGNPKKIKASVSAVDQGYFGDNTPYLADWLSPNSVRGEAWTTWLKAG